MDSYCCENLISNVGCLGFQMGSLSILFTWAPTSKGANQEYAPRPKFLEKRNKIKRERKRNTLKIHNKN
jgi:hypothetical protein